MIGNVIPYISGEEAKSEQEPLKIFGHIENGEIVKAEAPLITSQCIRIPVLNGHTAAVFVNFAKKLTMKAHHRLRRFRGYPQEHDLPSAPQAVHPVHAKGRTDLR